MSTEHQDPTPDSNRFTLLELIFNPIVGWIIILALMAWWVASPTTCIAPR